MKRIFLLIAAVIVIFSCNDNSKQTDSLFKFKKYISYTTSGLSSIADPITISLAKPVSDWKIGSEIDYDFIKITPHIEGKLIPINNHILVFKPDEYLDSSTEYTVTVNLSDIYKDVPNEFEKYTFQFKTITPSFNIVTGDLQSYSKNWQYLEGTIKLSDVAALNNAKQLIEASQDGKNLKVVFNELEAYSKLFNFKIDSIKRKFDDNTINIKWNGDAIDASNKGENTIKIPGINNFSVVDVKVIQSPEQFLSINFSDPLKKQQNFDGLVSIDKVIKPKFIVDGNVLRVYPSSKLVGNLKIEIFQGIKNTDGFKLKETFSETIRFEQLKPQIKLIGNGNILPNSKELKFNFKAVNLKAVDVRVIKIFENNVLQFLQDNNLNSNDKSDIKRVGRRIAKQTIQLETVASNTGKWKAYSIDLSKLFEADPGAIYRVELSYHKSYSLYNCDESLSESQDEYDYYDEGDNWTELSSEEQERREEEYWDNRSYRYRDYAYNWRERENPCSASYYDSNKILSQNLLASNIGVIVKRGTNNKYLLAATNILDTNPIDNAQVSIYNFQQQKISEGTTNDDGFLSIDVKKRAAFAIVSKDNNTSYVKLDDGNALSLSKFDVSGSKLQRGLKGYIYAERGVWRPGDSLHLTFMLNDVANPLPKNHPIKMEVFDPSGKLIYKKTSAYNVNNFFKFIVPTSTEGKTGNYRAKVSVGGAYFRKTLKVETVKPNRLKIKIDFDKEILVNNEAINGTLDVKWLHGSPAKNLKAEIKAKIVQSYAAFPKYKNYQFSDPTRKFETEEINVFEGNLDENGIAKINKSINVSGNAPGMLKAQFLVRAFENGGDFSIDAFSQPFAPYKSFVGLQKPEPDSYSSYYTDTNKTFDIVVVNAQGKPIKRNDLEVEVYKIEWRWWWNSSYEDLSSYTSSSYHRSVLNKKVNTDANGKGSFNINIPDYKYGRYLIRVIDPASGHATGCTAYFYKNWWNKSPSKDKESAKMLVFSADKDKYNVGETAKISFASGNSGRALISIENGTEILDYKWVKTNKGETTVDLPITKDMAPNVFINISLLQPHATSANDLPIRLYGVIPLMVEDPNTKLEPVIDMPNVLRPEQKFELKVSEKNKKDMTYTIAIVDEGLLDLTRFKTPNAWFEFYKREALGVNTWDIYDYVLGAYTGSVNKVFAIGGDGDAAKGKNKKANRFKPVVIFRGPFKLKAGETRKHNLELPNYIGAVRTMVVAGNNTTEAYGSSDKSVQVKKPLMVLASLPRKLSPGEKVTLPVTVFAMEHKVKNVNISLKLSNGISVVGEANKQITFNKPDEKMVYFDLDVSKAKGIKTIEVLANGNGEKSSYKVELDVFNPNPMTSRVIDKVVNPNEKSEIEFTPFGVFGTNKAGIEFSTLPPMNFSKRLEYLIQYPHGCVEQTTSSVFPQLFLGDIFDLTFDKKKAIQNNIEEAIKRLGYFQKPDGGLSYWMGGNSSSDWGSSYAGHFMIEAEKKGFVLPLTFKSNWIGYQKEAARNWRPSYHNYSYDLAQAYRLYTLALAGSPDLASMNRLREFEDISNDAKWRLAAAYALAGQKEASKAISSKANIHFETNLYGRYNYYSYGSVDRNRAMALETMVITKNPEMREIAEYLAKQLSSDRWMSTQTTAYSLLAMAKMVNANGGKDLNISYSINGKTETIKTSNAIAQRDLKISSGLNNINITNHKGNLVYVRVLNSGKLPLGEEMVEQRGLSVSVSYNTLSGSAIDVTNLKQGDDFIATVNVSNLKDENVYDVALNQIFPSGWEIVNTRFTDFGSTTTSQADYTDIRDDRVNFYFNMGKKGSQGSTKTFKVMLNASYLGTYYLFGVQAEAMYDNDYLVRSKGQWVNVSK